ncbi:hypothetical protein [Paenibacillus sp. FJAT-26967]|uniref:hypothetical protein n=1 Tax=Paenibacillus sp. FJAT-26967 TaxID=1729690 RepID=UPI000837E918|nr:hypothetical protein [Paenibacillus sp. FJAT-26967]
MKKTNNRMLVGFLLTLALSTGFIAYKSYSYYQLKQYDLTGNQASREDGAVYINSLKISSAYDENKHVPEKIVGRLKGESFFFSGASIWKLQRISEDECILFRTYMFNGVYCKNDV